jgi:hypothetical protein
MQVQTALDEYLSAKSHHVAPKTLSEKRRIIGYFSEWCTAQNPPSLHRAVYNVHGTERPSGRSLLRIACIGMLRSFPIEPRTITCGSSPSAKNKERNPSTIAVTSWPDVRSTKVIVSELRNNFNF